MHSNDIDSGSHLSTPSNAPYSDSESQHESLCQDQYNNDNICNNYNTDTNEHQIHDHLPEGNISNGQDQNTRS